MKIGPARGTVLISVLTFVLAMLFTAASYAVDSEVGASEKAAAKPSIFERLFKGEGANKEAAGFKTDKPSEAMEQKSTIKLPKVFSCETFNLRNMNDLENYTSANDFCKGQGYSAATSFTRRITIQYYSDPNCLEKIATPQGNDNSRHEHLYVNAANKALSSGDFQTIVRALDQSSNCTQGYNNYYKFRYINTLVNCCGMKSLILNQSD